MANGNDRAARTGKHRRRAGNRRAPQPPQPPQPPEQEALWQTAVTAAERRILSAERACDELLAAISLAAHAYHVRIEWKDECEVNELCLTLTPWLPAYLACETVGRAGRAKARFVLVLGDPLSRTICLSRRVLHLMRLRAQRPTALDLLPPVHALSDSPPPHGVRLAVGPVAQLALCQANALLTTAAWMTADGVTSSVYVTLAPRGLAEAATLVTPRLDAASSLSSMPSGLGVGSRLMGKVLALPRADLSDDDLVAERTTIQGGLARHRV